MCWDCTNHDVDPHKEFTQGGVGIDDFDEEFKYRKPAKKKAVKVKTRAGCPETDYKAHVYVWTSEAEDEKSLFFRFYGFHAREREVCVGCGKVRRSRDSERYEKRKAREWKKIYGDEFSVKRGEPISRFGRGPRYSWWHWEYSDTEFKAFRDDYVRRHGGNPYYGYGWWY